MKNIKPTYVTFEQAKWLKEIGFDMKLKYHYPNLSENQEICLPTNWNNFTDMAGNSYYFSAPEQWQVVEWLFLKHRLDIIVKYPESNTNKIEGINSVYYDLEIYKLQGGDAYKVYKFIGISDKKQVAYSKAFDYILNNNLI
jgi:hypothetical protein